VAVDFINRREAETQRGKGEREKAKGKGEGGKAKGEGNEWMSSNVL
jgi:hypothetical protein